EVPWILARHVQPSRSRSECRGDVRARDAGMRKSPPHPSAPPDIPRGTQKIACVGATRQPDRSDAGGGAGYGPLARYPARHFPTQLSGDDPPMSALLDDARFVLEAGSRLLTESVEAAKRLTRSGEAIDDHQVVTERVAYAATEAVAAHEVL